MFACIDFYFRLQVPLIIIHITYISLSLRRTSAPIHLTSVLGVLGTQETSCILIAGLLERDIFDLFLPEFDKPWVIHLRETCCCSTNLCTWRLNTVYKNRSVRRHHLHRPKATDQQAACGGGHGIWRPGQRRLALISILQDIAVHSPSYTFQILKVWLQRWLNVKSFALPIGLQAY
jgi:hypothetical protein